MTLMDDRDVNGQIESLQKPNPATRTRSTYLLCLPRNVCGSQPSTEHALRLWLPFLLCESLLHRLLQGKTGLSAFPPPTMFTAVSVKTFSSTERR